MSTERFPTFEEAAHACPECVTVDWSTCRTIEDLGHAAKREADLFDGGKRSNICSSVECMYVYIFADRCGV